jgi:hypothetical protein
MQNDTLMVFTNESRESLVSDGGTKSWHLNPSNVRQCSYVVCARNTKAVKGQATEEHGTAFLIGKIEDLVPAPAPLQHRWRILFSEFAPLNLLNAWGGEQNPVRYTSSEALGIDPNTLDWQPMPPPSTPPKTSLGYSPQASPLTLTEAKQGLALTFGVTPEAIEIVIRG